MEDEREPFLGHKDGEFSEFASCHRRHYTVPPHRRWTYWACSVIIHASLALLWIIPGIMVRTTVPARNELYNPTNNALEYTIHTPPRGVWNSHLYMGEPSHKSDEAWNALMKHQTVRLNADEAARLNTSAAPLPDSGHATMFALFHNLHCLRRLRQYMYPEYYYPNRSTEAQMADAHHTTHCLEAIRTSLMCYPDLTPLPLVWGGGSGHPLLAAANVPRRCVNWDRLMEWSVPRNYNYDDILEGMKEAGLEDEIPAATPHSTFDEDEQASKAIPLDN